MHQLKLASVIGSPLENSWSQLVFSPEYKLICALGIKGNNAKNVGFEFAELLENQEDLSAAAIHNFILDLLKKAREFEVSLYLALIGFNQSKYNNGKPKTTLATYQGQILLKRHNKVGTILKSEGEINIIEGSLNQGDEFLLGTAQTEQLEQSIKQLFKADLSPDALASNLNQKVQMLVNSSLLASAIVKIEKIEYPKIKTKIEEQKTTIPILKQESSPFLGELVTDKESKESKVDDEISISQEPNEKILNKKDQTPSDLLPPTDHLEENEEDESKTELTDVNKEDEALISDEKKEIKIKISLDPIKKLTVKGSEKFKIFLGKFVHSLKNKSSQLIQNVKKAKEAKQQAPQSSYNDHTLSNSEEEKSSLAKSSVGSSSRPKKTTRFSRIFKQVLSFIKIFSFINPKMFFSKPKEIYLGKKDGIKKKNIAIVIAIILLIVLTVNFVSASITNQKKQIQQELEPAQELLNQAKSLENQDILQARDLAAQSIETALATQKDLGNSRLTRREFDKFIESAQSYFNEIDGQVEVSQLEIFLDLREVFPNFITSETTNNDQYLFFIDKQQNQLIAVRATDGRSHRLSLEEQLEISDFTTSQEELFILNSGIYTLSLDEIENSEDIDWSATPSLIKEEGDSDRESIFIDYYEGFLYVFNPVRRNIFRYIVRDSELSDPIGWITNSQGIEFASITSLTIDGQVWLTSNNGDIFRLERGVPLEFEIRGLDDPLGSSINIHTNQNSEYLYILESAKKRLVILSKSGEFVRQIISPSLAGTTHIVVDENVGKAFVVSGSIVYQILL